MKILISGPFGLGSLSDEIVLAGVLKPLRAAKHQITVVSADHAATADLHDGVEVVELATPTSMLSTPATYKALDEAHFFGLCGAGVISEKGKPPARAWLTQIEAARQMKVISAVIGAGAIPIPDRHEQARAQRALHHFADGISVRDDASKLAMISCGMNANRVSCTGDPTLALFDEAAAKKPRESAPRRVAFFFTDGVPQRQTFAPEPTYAPATLGQGLNALLKTLAANGTQAVIFHDDTRQNLKLAESIADGAPDAELFGPDATIPELRAAMASCGAAITDTLHGLLFAAVHAVPAVYLDADGAAPDLVARLGLTPFALQSGVGDFDSARAHELLRGILDNPDAPRAGLIAAVAGLAKKEAQNARMIERLVPKRLRFAKEE